MSVRHRQLTEVDGDTFGASFTGVEASDIIFADEEIAGSDGGVAGQEVTDVRASGGGRSGVVDPGGNVEGIAVDADVIGGIAAGGQVRLAISVNMYSKSHQPTALIRADIQLKCNIFFRAIRRDGKIEIVYANLFFSWFNVRPFLKIVRNIGNMRIVSRQNGADVGCLYISDIGQLDGHFNGLARFRQAISIAAGGIVIIVNLMVCVK